MTAGARSPEELERLFEDALLVGDRTGLRDLVDEGAVLTSDGGVVARGVEDVGRAALELRARGRTYVGATPRVLRSRDTALLASAEGVLVARRRGDGTWRVAIAVLAGRAHPNGRYEGGTGMQAVDLHDVELMDIESPLDPSRRVRVAFPISSSTGTAASAAVYFEVEPGAHVGVHTDSAEELLVVLEGTAEGLLGEDVARLRAGQVLVVPAMVRHDMTNIGDGPLRVLGTFASSTVVATFEEPLGPEGPQVFVIGAAMPILLPLAAAPA